MLTERFTMRLSPDDKIIFAELAARTGRTESDAIRLVITIVTSAMIESNFRANDVQEFVSKLTKRIVADD